MVKFNLFTIGSCKVSAREKELKAYRKIHKDESNTPLNQYLDFCRVSLKVSKQSTNAG
jgi:hypothetical protein